MHDPLAHLPGYVLSRASAAILADLKARLAPLGLRHTDAAILVLIGANPGMTQSQIGRALAIERANMVPMINRLETRALLTRSPVDGRSQGLSLSASGNEMLAKVQQAMTENEALIEARLAGTDQYALMQALRSLF